MPPRRKLSAILFVDMVGFTQQVHRNEALGLEQRRRFEEAIRTLAAGHHGRVVKTIGDGAMLEFASAVEAMTFALEVQESTLTAEPGTAPPLRIGLHLGDVVEEDDDLYGNAVNVAARLEKIAPPGGICFSRELYQQVRSALQSEAAPVSPVRLAQLPEPMEVMEVLLRPEASVRVTGRSDPGDGNALRRCQEQAARRRRAEARLSEVWTPVRRLATFASLLFPGLPAGLVAAHWLGGDAATLFSVMLATPVLTNFSIWGVQAGVKWSARVDPGYARVLALCAELGTPPEAVAGPLNQALEAFLGMRRLAREPLWRRSGIPTDAFIRSATERLEGIVEWSRRLQIIGGSLTGTKDPDPDMRAEYDRQCEQFAAAADLFRQAQVKMMRAFAALSADHSPGSPGARQFQEITATFEALSEVLHEGKPDVVMPEGPRADQSAPARSVQIGGLGGDRRDD